MPHQDWATHPSRAGEFSWKETLQLINRSFFKVCNGVRDCPGGGDEFPLPEIRREQEDQPKSIAHARNWSLVHQEKACLVKTEKMDSTSVLLPIVILVCLVTLLLALYLVMLQN